MNEPKFIDGPGPDSQAGPKFIDGPGPDSAPQMDQKTADAQIIRALGYDPAKIQAGKNYQPGEFVSHLQNAVQSAHEDAGSTLGKKTAQFLHGFPSTVEGAAQGLAHLAGLDTSNWDAHRALDERVYQDITRGGDKSIDWTSMLGSVLGTPMVPGSQGAKIGLTTKAGLQALTRASATGALYGAAQPVYDHPDDFWKQKGQQALGGAILGPAVQVGLERAADPLLGKLTNIIQNRMKPGVAEVQQLGDQFGVRLSAGDITGSPGLKKTEVALEQVPGVGMGAFRQAQDKEAQAAAQNYASNLGAEMGKTQYRNLDAVKQAAAKGDKRAIGLLQQVQAAGDDWTRILQTSGNMEAFQRSLKAGKLYDKVDQLASQAGDVPLVNTMRAIKSARAEIQASALPDKSSLAILDQLEANLGTQAQAKGAQAAVAGGGAAPAQASSMVDKSYAGMRRLRSDLGDLINDYYKGGNAVTGSKGVGILASVRGALEQDMNDFAQKSPVPGLRRAWQDADGYYKANVVPYKDRLLAGALKDAAPDEIFGKFIQAGKGDRAQNFYNALDPKGQAAVRYGMVQNALEGATNPEKGLDGASFSPARFAQNLERLKDASGVAFKGMDKFQLDGLTNLMRHVERAGQFAENPPTGNRLAPLLLSGGAGAAAATGHAPELAAGWLSAAGLKQLLTTKTGQRILLAASDMKPGSPAMEKLLQQAKALGGVAGGQNPFGSQVNVTDPALRRLMGLDNQPQQ